MKTVLPNFNSPNIFQINKRSRPKVRRTLECYNKPRPQHLVESETIDTGLKRYQAKPLRSYWRILSVMEHNTLFSTNMMEVDNSQLLKIVFCVFRANKVSSPNGNLLTLMPILVLRMTRSELFATNIHYVDELVRKRVVCVSESIMLMEKSLRFCFPPSMCKDLQKLDKEVQEAYHDCVQKLHYIVEDGDPKQVLPEIYSSTVDLIEAAILLKQYAFARGTEYVDMDHIKFATYRFHYFKEIVDKNGWEPFNDFLSDSVVAHASVGMHALLFNSPEFYKKFWGFMSFSRWCIHWRQKLFTEKQLDLSDKIHKVSWLQYKVKDIISLMLKTLEMNGWFNERMTSQYWVNKMMSGKCICGSHGPVYCKSCAQLISELMADLKKRTAICIQNYDYVSYFRDVLKANATTEQLTIAQQKLKSYDPCLVDWVPNERGGSFSDGSDQLTACTRSDAQIVNKKLEYKKLISIWALTQRNLKNVNMPLESMLSTTLMQNHHGSNVPIISKPYPNKSNAFGVVVTKRKHWASTPAYHTMVHKFSCLFEEKLNGIEGMRERMKYAHKLNEETNNAIELDVLSVIYGDLLTRCAKEIGAHQLQEALKQETGGSFHIKFDKRLSLFSVMADVDMANATTDTCVSSQEIMSIGRAYYKAIMTIVYVNRMLVQNKKDCDLDHYLQHSEDIKNSRLYVYWSQAVSLPKEYKKCQEREVIDGGNRTIFLNSENDGSGDIGSMLQEYNKNDKNDEDRSVHFDNNAKDRAIIHVLNRRKFTRSLRICVELPPNVSFFNIEAFKSYQPMIMSLLKGTEVGNIACRVAKNGDIAEMFDERILLNQCRLPMSAKADGTEPFQFIFVMPSMAHSTNATALHKMAVNGCFDKTMGLVHKDQYPLAIDDMTSGMVIMGCTGGDCDTTWTMSTSLKKDSITRRMLTNDHMEHEAKIESKIIQECIEVRRRSPECNGDPLSEITTLEEALNIVVKPALLDAISCSGSDNLPQLIPSSLERDHWPDDDLKRRTPGETISLLSTCYITVIQKKRKLLNDTQEQKYLHMYVSRTKAHSRSESSAGKFPSCLFYNHRSMGGFILRLLASMNARNGRVSFMVKYFCFKPRCAGNKRRRTQIDNDNNIIQEGKQMNTIFSFQLKLNDNADITHLKC